MATRSGRTLQNPITSTAVGALLEQKREQSEGSRGAGDLKGAQREKPTTEPFIPATARSDLTNPLATPGSGMFPDCVDPSAPSG